MACFVVPAVEAVAVTAAYLVAKKKEQKIATPKLMMLKSLGQRD